MINTQENQGMVLGILGVTAFGLTLPVTRYVVPYMDPVFIGLGRAVVAAFFAALLLILSRQTFPSRSQLKKLILVSLGVVIGFPLFSAWGMQTVPAAHGGVVLGVLPLFTAITAVLISNERPSLGFWIAGVAGSMAVVSYALLQGVGSVQSGDLFLLAAVLSAATGYALGGTLSREMGGWQVICWALVLALPFIIFPAWYYAPETMNNLPTSVWMGFLYLALVSQLLGFFLWNKGLALGGVARVSQAQLLQPFITLLAAAILLKESIDALTISFAALVVILVAIGKKMPIYQNTP